MDGFTNECVSDLKCAVNRIYLKSMQKIFCDVVTCSKGYFDQTNFMTKPEATECKIDIRVKKDFCFL